jgi:DNA-directed RNA polymerase subunit RPC12/RpoP
MIKIADFKCEKCSKVIENLEIDEEHKCDCGGNLLRIFGLRKEMQMLPHWDEHMDHDPVWIEDYGHYKKEMKKRGYEGVSLKKHFGKTKYFI